MIFFKDENSEIYLIKMRSNKSGKNPDLDKQNVSKREENGVKENLCWQSIHPWGPRFNPTTQKVERDLEKFIYPQQFSSEVLGLGSDQYELVAVFVHLFKENTAHYKARGYMF